MEEKSVSFAHGVGVNGMKIAARSSAALIFVFDEGCSKMQCSDGVKR